MYRIWTAAILVLFAALIAAAFAFSTPAQTQDETYVDLSIDVVAATGWRFIVRNHGTADAYGVTLDIEIADQTIHSSSDGFEQNSATTCSGNIPGTTCISGVWTVGFLGVGEEMEFNIGSRLASGLPCCTAVSDKWSIPARAVIKSQVPEEEDRFKGDNADVDWMFVSQGGGAEKARGQYWLRASVDDLLPDAGDTVKFSFKGDTAATAARFLDDIKVRLKLDNGMGTPTATAPTGTTFAAATGLDRTWDWDIGKYQVNTLEVSTTLDDPLPSGVARSDLCLTAELTARPDNTLVSVGTSTTAKICLREDPVTLLQTGETHLFTVLPCVGVSTHPCSSSDTVEMVVNGGESARAAGIARDDAIMDPRDVIVQVKDPESRTGTGSNLAWGSAESGLSTSIDNSRLSSADWTHFLWKIASVQLPTGGNLSIHPDATRSATFVHTGNKAQHPPGGLTAMPAALKVAFATYIKFDSLGTYVIDFTQETTHNNGTTSDTTDDVDYSGTGRYTFHVGPVTELEVRDNGPNPELAPTQRAFTIVAVNNGPEDAPAAQVTVTGLNASDYVSHTASHGTFNSTTGIWTIGELGEDSGYYRAAGHPLGWPALTIITSAALDTEITAAISNTQDYQVCIDSSGGDVDLSSPSETACTTEDSTNTWHTAEYYDYVSGNDSAAIKARTGTGESLPGLQTPQEDTTTIVVEWDPVGALNGRMVTRYEVEWSADGETGWQQLSGNVSENRYVDTAVEPGDMRYYRVRAVNDRGRKGAWSAPMKGTASMSQTATAGKPEAPVITASIPEGAGGRTQIDLEWEKPIENGAAITSYTVEVADSSNGPWAAPDPAPQLGGGATSWSHEDLTGGTRKYYRMKATNSQGDSEWSEVIDAATRAPGKAGPPLNVQAAPDGDAAIDLMWGPPLDDGGATITRYEVQWSADGVSNWRSAGNTPDRETRTFKQGGMTFGTTRYYRVAARNRVGLGDWSDPPVSTTTLAGVPGAPRLTARSDVFHTIALSWTVPPDNGEAIIRYELQWSPDGTDGSWLPLATPAAADTAYPDGGLDPGTKRHYRIRAVNDTGNGSWSPPVHATTPPDKPVAPSLEAAANGENVIDLSWTEPDTRGAPITRYEIEVSPDGSENSWSRLTNPSASARAYAHTRLQPGTEQHYRLRAQNRAGYSEWSVIANATTLTGVPAAPRLTVRAENFGAIKLTWTVPDDKGDPITGYEIEASPDGSDWSSLDGTTAADTAYDHAGLDPGTERHYRVRAFNSGGNGAWSTPGRATTPPDVPRAPELRAGSNGQNAIDLWWTEPDNRGASITGYELQVSADGSDDSWSRLASPSASALSYTHSRLQPGDERHYRLRARNRAGSGDWSYPAVAVTLPGVPAAPSWVTAEANGTTEIKLAWTKPDDGGSNIFSYELHQSGDGKQWEFLDSGIPAGDAAYVHGGLSDGTTRHYRVRAVNFNGNGQWSQTRTARTDPGGPEAPVMLTATAMGEQQIDLSWDAPPDDNGSPVTGYRIERSRDGNAPWERLADRHRTRAFSDTGLYRGTTRHYRVAAANRTGTGPFSEVKSATTDGDPAQPPKVPRLLYFSDIGRNQVTLAWEEPEDDGGAPVTGYEYDVSPPCPDDPATPDKDESERNCGFGVDRGTAVTSTSVRVSGLNVDGDYYFRVRAVNPIGDGDWSQSVHALLRPTTSGRVIVSPTSITVDEGATVTYTVRLSTAPPHPVQLYVQPRGIEGSQDLQDAAFAYTGSVLIPNGWTHPHGEDWSKFAYNWSQGVRVTFTAPEDDDALDDVAVMDHFVIRVSYDSYRPCTQEDQAEQDRCRQDWDDDWTASPYAYLTGAGVKVTVQDND